MTKHLLVVDEDQGILDLLQSRLEAASNDWSITFVERPEQAWDALLHDTYAAVMADVRTPGLNALELLERVRTYASTGSPPIVVLTGLHTDDGNERLDADDLSEKPLPPNRLIARLRTALQTKTYQENLRAINELLADKVQRQSIDLAQSRMTIFCRLGMAAELRDEDTGNHVVRVGCYSRAIAAAMGMPRPFLEQLVLAAPLHDIGKIGIPDSVLLKPGPLTDEEWKIMQRHCAIGESILRQSSKALLPLLDWYAIELSQVQEQLERHDPVLQMAATVALTHHEKWDGGGYPQGLKGKAIPLESRIVAIADVFDSLTSNRPYRPARPEEEALSIIAATVGSDFDPAVYAAFRQALDEVRSIRDRFTDEVAAGVCPQAGPRP